MNAENLVNEKSTPETLATDNEPMEACPLDDGNNKDSSSSQSDNELIEIPIQGKRCCFNKGRFPHHEKHCGYHRLGQKMHKCKRMFGGIHLKMSKKCKKIMEKGCHGHGKHSEKHHGLGGTHNRHGEKHHGHCDTHHDIGKMHHGHGGRHHGPDGKHYKHGRKHHCDIMRHYERGMHHHSHHGHHHKFGGHHGKCKHNEHGNNFHKHGEHQHQHDEPYHGPKQCKWHKSKVHENHHEHENCENCIETHKNSDENNKQTENSLEKAHGCHRGNGNRKQHA